MAIYFFFNNDVTASPGVTVFVVDEDFLGEEVGEQALQVLLGLVHQRLEQRVGRRQVAPEHDQQVADTDVRLEHN